MRTVLFPWLHGTRSLASIVTIICRDVSVSGSILDLRHDNLQFARPISIESQRAHNDR